MMPIEAAWVRENVWPSLWLRKYLEIPGTFHDCACYRPPSVECQRDRHTDCRHDGHAINETVIQTSSLRAAAFRDPYAHYSPVRSGRNVVAWVWPAGRPCRQLCNCGCHRGAHAEPEAAPKGPAQLDLFDLAVTR